MTTPRCRRGDRCAARTRCDQKEWHAAPTDRPLCDTCERATAAVLADVPYLYLDLENALPPGSVPPTAGGPGRGKITGSPLGINPGAAHLQEQARQLLTAWEDAIRTTAGYSTIDRRAARPGRETQRAAAFLARHLTAWVVHRPITIALTATTADPDDPKAQPTDQPITVTQAGWEAAAWLIDWRHRVRATIGVTTPARQRDEPCMYCEVRAVVEVASDAGYDQIRCEACQRTWPRDDYLRRVRGFEPYLRKLAADQKKGMITA